MGIENKKIVEKSEEEDLRRQSATSLGFKGKLTNDPFDLHGEICNLCISKNPKPMIDLKIDLTVKKIKMYILSLFVKRVEEGKKLEAQMESLKETDSPHPILSSKFIKTPRTMSNYKSPVIPSPRKKLKTSGVSASVPVTPSTPRR